MKPIVVTGVIHSGTRSMAKLLTQAGRQCKHEKLFPSYADKPPEKLLDEQADSSGMAAPHVGRYIDYAHVIHLVRNPFMVIRSLWGSSMFKVVTQAEVMWKHTPLVTQEFADEPEQQRRNRIVRFVVDWNRLVDQYAKHQNYLLHRIEDDPAELLKTLGLTELHETPVIGKYNHTIAVPTLTDIPEHLREDLAALCTDYGYDC